MTPGAHLLISWLSTVPVFKQARERIIVSLSGLAPDLDGAGLIIDKLWGNTNYYEAFHHYLGHNIFAAIVIASVASLVAKSQKNVVWIMAFCLVHVHIVCDIIGSKGLDGYQWPIYYFYPLDNQLALTWEHQWLLNGWQNQVLMLGLLSLVLFVAKNKEVSFLEVISQRLDKAAFDMYKKYFKGNK